MQSSVKTPAPTICELIILQQVAKRTLCGDGCSSYDIYMFQVSFHIGRPPLHRPVDSLIICRNHELARIRQKQKQGLFTNRTDSDKQS